MSPASTPAGSSATARIRAEIDLPTPVAIWVLTAHAITLVSPIVVLWLLDRHRDVLGDIIDRPHMLAVGSAFFLIGSAFEVAQNTMDRWYYEGPYPAFADLLFNLFIALGLAAFALAAGAHGWWYVVVVAVAAVAFPVLYLTDRVPYPATGVLGVAAVVTLTATLQRPEVLWLAVTSTGLNLYFLSLVVRTRAQSLHGAIALSNGIGMLAFAFALWRAATVGDATRTDWTLTLISIAVAGLVAGVAYPRLRRLTATRRPSGLSAHDRTSAEAA